ncbi:hypothetical protein AAMO2058_000112800 [Amorphochlora amoebiformis]
MGAGKSKKESEVGSVDDDGNSRVVLCLAGSQSTRDVSAVARKHGFQLLAVKTVKDAIGILKSPEKSKRLIAVVAALGVKKGVDMIFDLFGDRSSVIDAAKSLKGVHVIIYSHTACRNPLFHEACMDAGADDVVCSQEALSKYIRTSIAGALIALVESQSFELEEKSEEKRQEMEGTPKAKGGTPKAKGGTPKAEGGTPEGKEGPQKIEVAKGGDRVEDYPPIVRRAARERALKTYLKDIVHQTEVKQYLRQISEFNSGLFDMIQALPNPLLSSKRDAKVVRCVHISDTHHHHRYMHIPQGDILFHTGDTVGNYGDSDVNVHFQDFATWVSLQAKRFKAVVFIAGNHDTQLDGKEYDDRISRKILKSLPKNVYYLQNSQVNVLGLKIWGSPLCVSRLETMGKRYYSNAFERKRSMRREVFKKIPENLDILLTHQPPNGPLAHPEVGDEVLTRAIRALKKPPKYHLFGHDHDYIGVSTSKQTISINGAQETVLRLDKVVKKLRDGGGFAWMFDVEV